MLWTRTRWSVRFLAKRWGETSEIFGVLEGRLRWKTLCGYFRSLCFPSWSTADGTDDPLEAAKDSIFVKILLKLLQEGEKCWLSFNVEKMGTFKNPWQSLFPSEWWPLVPPQVWLCRRTCLKSKTCSIWTSWAVWSLNLVLSLCFEPIMSITCKPRREDCVSSELRSASEL